MKELISGDVDKMKVLDTLRQLRQQLTEIREGL